MSQLRRDSVTGRWVIFHTDRTRCAEELLVQAASDTEERSCVYCEGREAETRPEIWALRKPGTSPNGSGWYTRVIPHRIAALHVEDSLDREGVGMFDKMKGVGAHEIVIDTPDHKRDIANLDVSSIEGVLTAYRERIIDLRRDTRLRYSLVFKNQGKGPGLPDGHSISQIIATPNIPQEVKLELVHSKTYYDYKQRCLFCDMIREERQMGERLVLENDHYLVLEPFASCHPFETWILPKKHRADFTQASSPGEVRQLAEALKSSLTLIKDALLRPSYSFVLHSIPNTVPEQDYWQTIDLDYHWHLEIIPRVRTETGFERGSGFFVNPVLPEQAAQFLRERISKVASN